MLALLQLPASLVPVCRLLHEAENLAMRCAARQADLAFGRAGLERRLRAQARHEAAHAALFAAVLARSPAVDEAALAPPVAALAAYEARLAQALHRRDLAASLVGLQGVLEGVGTVLLQAFHTQGALKRLVRVLLAQERAHHGLGRAFLDKEGLELAAPYCEDATALLAAAGPLLSRAGVDAAAISPRHIVLNR